MTKVKTQPTNVNAYKMELDTAKQSRDQINGRIEHLRKQIMAMEPGWVDAEEDTDGEIERLEERLTYLKQKRNLTPDVPESKAEENDDREELSDNPEGAEDTTGFGFSNKKRGKK